MQYILRLFSLALLFWSAAVSATMMDFTATNLGGNTWQYDYSVTNDTLAFEIEEFTIYFDYNSYANLATVADAPPGWDSIVIQPDSGLPDDGFYDSLALVSGIAPGETLSGFSVTVDYLGTGLPGAQFWEIVDPMSFATLDQGTSVGSVITTVDEPATSFLLLLGLLAAIAARNQRRQMSCIRSNG